MAITIGAVTLNQYISWIGKHNLGVPGSERATLGNRVVVNRLPGQNNSEIILEAREEDNVRKGYFLKADLDTLETYRDAGTQLACNYHGETFTAMIPTNGINVYKALWSSTDSLTEKWIGTITLKRVT